MLNTNTTYSRTLTESARVTSTQLAGGAELTTYRDGPRFWLCERRDGNEFWSVRGAHEAELKRVRELAIRYHEARQAKESAS